MAFLVNAPQAIVSVIPQLFQGEPCGIQTGFRQPVIFKHLDASGKQIQSLADYVLSHVFGLARCCGEFENDRKK